MGIAEKFLNSIKFDAEDEEEFEPDEDLDGIDDYYEETARSKKSSSYRYNEDSALDLDYDDEEPDAEEPEEEYEEPAKKSFLRFNKKSQTPVTPMKNHTNTSSNNMEVCMIKPTSINDSREIVFVLLENKAVVINMEGLNIDIAQRIIDFASGACFAMNGNLQTISGSIFIITPSNINLTGDFSNAIGAGVNNYSSGR